MQKYQQITSSPQIAEQPKGDRSYLHTVTAGALLPLIQAGVSGLAAGVLMLILFSSARSRDMFTAAGVSVVIVFIVVWFILERHWLLMTAERATRLDLNKDTFIGEPETPRQTLRIEVKDRSNPGAYHESIYDFPATPEQMLALAAGINSGTGFKEAYWTGNGAPFKQAEFRKLIAFMRQRGLIELVNDKSVNQGYRLSPAGQLLFERLASPPPPPPHLSA